jgi:hypothetical protein
VEIATQICLDAVAFFVGIWLVLLVFLLPQILLLVIFKHLGHGSVG